MIYRRTLPSQRKIESKIKYRHWTTIQKYFLTFEGNGLTELKRTEPDQIWKEDGEGMR